MGEGVHYPFNLTHFVAMITYLQILSILCVVAIMYYRTSDYDYVIDDVDVVKASEKLVIKNKWHNLWLNIKGHKYDSPRFAHNLNTLVHAIVCVLIFLAFGRTPVSYLASLLFALNPVNNQASIWVSGRGYASGTAILLFGWWLLPIFPIMWMSTFTFLTSGMFMPLLFVLKEPHWGLALLPLIMLFGQRHIFNAIEHRAKTVPDLMIKVEPLRIIVYFKTLGYYFLLCLFPLRLGMFHKYLSGIGMTEKENTQAHEIDKFFYVGVALFLTTCFGILLKPCTTTFGLLWFVVLTSQWCNIIVLNHPITERYIYLPNVGLMIALSSLIVNTPLMLIFLTGYALRLYYFMPAYKDMMSYWKSNIDNFPDASLGYNQYGLALISYGNSGTACDMWVRGVQERPHDFRLNFNLAKLFYAVRDIQKSYMFIKTAEENMDRKNDVAFWQGEINTIKQECEKHGYRFPNPTTGS